MKKLIFIHLRNDYTGSAKVLSQTIKAFQKKKYDVELYTGKSGTGFLSDLTDQHYLFFYKRFESKYLTLISFMLSQTHLFFKLVKKYRNDDIIFYVNTMLPFGAAIAGALTGKPVYYHLHETSIEPASFKSFLRNIVQKCASKVTYVSKSLQEMESFQDIPSELIYNALSNSLMRDAQLHDYQWRRNGSFEVLMLCSLRAYKGVNEFVAIAALSQKNESLKFTLLLNADKDEIDAYFKDIDLPENITLVSKQNDVVPFYKNASLLLNLSRIDQWVETFGLTIIEAIAFGIPVIVPPVGGPTEIIRDGKEGYLVSSYDTELVTSLITDLATDESKCMMLSAKAKDRSKTFSEDIFDAKIVDSLAKLTS